VTAGPEGFGRWPATMSYSWGKMELGVGGFVVGLQSGNSRTQLSPLEEDGCPRQLLRHLARSHDKAECSAAVFTRREAVRKRRGTRPRHGSYVGIRMRYARGGGDCMGCTWSRGGGRPTAPVRGGGQ
jgi:hypothetical protein